jgi:hypothetical protein
MKFTTTSSHQPRASRCNKGLFLDRVEKQKGFVYSEARMTKTGEIEFMLRPRRGSRPICGSCGKKGATYDHTSFRRFEFVPLWGVAVFFVSPMRRVDCCRCGVTTERIPRSCGNHQQTFSYRCFWPRGYKYLADSGQMVACPNGPSFLRGTPRQSQSLWTCHPCALATVSA